MKEKEVLLDARELKKYFLCICEWHLSICKASK